MTHEFLPQFRRRLFDWLQLRLGSGRTPFRRVEELPEVLTSKRVSTPDLVLWINRDSLLAGAMILIPPKVEAARLQHAGEVAGALGLRQFVTWEARAVNIWETGDGAPTQLKSWAMPAADRIDMDDFAVVFEQLLQELKGLAVSAALPAEQLPPAYFANLCRQVLHSSEATLLESARVAAKTGQADARTRQSALDKGWLTLWRLLALLLADRLPPGVRPERLERAIGYALAGLDPQLARHLALSPGEPPLPEDAAVRFHHLAGRLAQLGWQCEPLRAQASLRLLLAETARDCRVETIPLDVPPERHDLLFNHIPPQPLAETSMVAPQPCLAGHALTACNTGDPLPAHMVTGVPLLPAEPRPPRIVANLLDDQPLPATQRRQRLIELRHPWPYRRFELPANSPAWLWDALYLGGLVDPEGQMQLLLPSAWTEAPGADQLWRALVERQTLGELTVHADGRQTLTMVAHDRVADQLAIRYADGTQCHQPLLLDEAGLADLAALSLTSPGSSALESKSLRRRSSLGGDIATRVFRDGLPRFPEDYLRRLDLPPLRSYQLSGPLQAGSSFFDRIRLTGPDGTVVESDNPADAEALLLASRDGRRRVELPTDQALTMRMIDAYRNDLQRLWQELLSECRRHHPTQRAALSLARRLWRERNLPPMASG